MTNIVARYRKSVFLLLVVVALVCQQHSAAAGRKILIAHRGASAYTPEHTLEAYRLALAQGADFVEQDLQITRDGVLVCLHDLTLERTTDVEEVFPDRFKEENGKRHWYVADFTLAEIKRLDAGAWFNAKFQGARVPTWQEAIDLIRGKAGLYPETKGPEVYGQRGFEMERLVLAELQKNKLDRPRAAAKTPVIIQSFSAESLRKMALDLKTKLPLVFLISDRDERAGQWLTAAGLQEIKKFAQGIGPAKGLLEQDPSIVKRAQAAGLTVTPYTFKSSDIGRYKNVREEMRHFLFTLGVDALFTDNPDQFPRSR
jgi:glycerophosphoryl diester phosphodiesterase